MSNPTVSVILPTYNHGHFVPLSLASMRAQTFTDYEVIIIDDGSKDDTQAIVAPYLEDSRIQYHYQTNHGLAAARNAGLRIARGKYVTFLDADDEYDSEKLAAQVEFLDAHPEIGLVSGGWDVVNEHNQLILHYLPGADAPDLGVKSQLHSCYFVPVSVMVRKEWVERVGGFYEALRQVEDWDLWLRLAAAGCQMAWIDQVVCNYRLSPGQMTKNATQQKQASLQMLDRFYAQPNLPDDLQAIRLEVYARLYIISAGREYANMQVEEAKDSLGQAVRIYQKMQRPITSEALALLFDMEKYPNPHGTVFHFRKYILEHLPPMAGEIHSQRKQILAEAAAKTFYNEYARKNWGLVRQAAGNILRYAPERIWNVGYWSILTRSLVYSVFRKQAT